MKIIVTIALILTLVLSGCAGPDEVKPATTTDHTQNSVMTHGSAHNLILAVTPMAPSMADAFSLSGTVNAEVQLTVTAARNGTAWQRETLVATGAWNVSLVNTPFGDSVVTVIADDGFAPATVQVPLTRLASYTLQVKYGGYPGLTNSLTPISMNPDAFVSAPEYAKHNASHPGFATVHDLTLAWANETGATLELAWSETFKGFSVSRINGAGSPVSSAFPPYWLLRVNNQTAEFGMSLMPVSPSDYVQWCLNTCS